MTDRDILSIAALSECSTVRALLELLESTVPSFRIIDAPDETMICFPLPDQRKHTVSCREHRLGDGPRVWLLSARAGMLESLAATGFSAEGYNSQADLGFACIREGVVHLQAQLIKTYSSPMSVVMTAFSLARQADALERCVSETDEL